MSLATLSNNLKSWETTTTPPLKALMASAKESIVAKSKPLVGSSNKIKLGASNANNAKRHEIFDLQIK